MTEKGEYLWIRAVSFVSMRELIFELIDIEGDFRAKDINNVALNIKSIITQKGQKPSKTTLYHYRNILLHLGVLTRINGLYSINREDPYVLDLISSLQPGLSELSPEERIAWGEIILRAEDCKKRFFDLFMPGKEYKLKEFIEQGESISWQTVENPEARLIKLYNINSPENNIILQTEDDIQAILYGVRYWARNEIKIISEFFLEDLGGVMYPIDVHDFNKEDQVAVYLHDTISAENSQWLTFSIRDLLLKLGPRLRLPVDVIHKIIIKLQHNYSEFIVFIPTAESFATITASSKLVEKYQLRGYLQDEKGRFISHIRIHKKFKEMYHAQ